MAVILGQITVDSVVLMNTDVNPALGVGTPAPVGSACIASDGSGLFFKQDVGDTAWGKAPAPQVIALVDGATIPLDASQGNEFTVTLGGNRTLQNPTNPSDGQKIVVTVKQDATGSRTLTLDTAYKFGTDIPALNLSTTANAIDYIGFVYSASSTKWNFVSLIRGF